MLSAALENKVTLFLIIYALSGDTGHFFQIWSLVTSTHIFGSIRFDAVVCDLLGTTNLEISEEEQTVQNGAAKHLTANRTLTIASVRCPSSCNHTHN